MCLLLDTSELRVICVPQELEKNETLHDEEEPEEGLKKNAEGEVEEDEETVDEDEYDEVELEEV